MGKPKTIKDKSKSNKKILQEVPREKLRKTEKEEETSKEIWKIYLNWTESEHDNTEKEKKPGKPK